MRKCLIAFVVVLTLIFSSTSVFAALPADPAVTIVSPVAQSINTAGNLLVSVKVTQPRTVRISVFEKKQIVNGVPKSVNLNAVTSANMLDLNSLESYPVMGPVDFVCKNNLSFYTKQIDVKPGIYEIRVETLDSAGKVKYSKSNPVGVKQNQDDTTEVFDTQQSGTFQFLQNVLKSIFKS